MCQDLHALDVILNIPSLGARDVLVVPAKQQVGLTVMLVVGDCRCVHFIAQYVKVVVFKHAFKAHIQLLA